MVKRTGELQKNDRWIRLPVRGYCPYTGLSRGHMYRLIGTGVIRSANIVQPGNVRGVRLVWLPSVLEYIERHVEKSSGVQSERARTQLDLRESNSGDPESGIATTC